MSAPSKEAPYAKRVVYALKPMSWPKTLVVALLGFAVASFQREELRPSRLVASLVLTAALTCFIVLINDFADREVDRIKRRLFPAGCSPKTIPDGLLDAPQVLVMGVVSGLVFLAGTTFVASLWSEPALLWLAPLCMGCFALYTLPPVKLNYRGGGELLEMVGVGILLPAFTCVLSGGQPGDGAISLWAATAMLALSSAAASGLSDEVSDRQGGKRTLATMVGNPLTRAIAERALDAGIALLLVAAFASSLPSAALLAGGACALTFRPRVRNRSDFARTNAFSAQARYKSALHAAIWTSPCAVAFVLLWASW